jgi:hypothetical protein
MYWLEGRRGDGIGSIGVGCNGSNGRLGSIGIGYHSRDYFDPFVSGMSKNRLRIALKRRA